MPLRDGRRGRRATLGSGSIPFRPTFGLAEAPAHEPLGGEAVRLRADSDAGLSSGIAVAASEGGSACDVPGTVRCVPVSDPEYVIAPGNADGASDIAPGCGPELAPPHERKTSRAAANLGMLDPLSAVAALAKPLHVRASIWRRYAAAAAPERHAGAPDAPDADVVSERSFAHELASLLGTGRARPLGAQPGASEPHEAPIVVNDASAARSMPPDAAVVPAAKPQRNFEPGDGIPHAIDATTAIARGAAESEQECSEPAGVATLREVATGTSLPHEIVVRAMRPASERAVPLTRLPLRSQSAGVSWPASYDPSPVPKTVSRAERHAILEQLVRTPGCATSSVIEAAYREEDALGRVLALRVLVRHFPGAGNDAYLDALRNGGEEERSLAIDGLAALGARRELALALDDRLDALAAKAALAYVGTLARDDYRTQLAPLVDTSRIDAILKLLAGIVE